MEDPKKGVQWFLRQWPQHKAHKTTAGGVRSSICPASHPVSGVNAEEQSEAKHFSDSLRGSVWQAKLSKEIWTDPQRLGTRNLPKGNLQVETTPTPPPGQSTRDCASCPKSPTLQLSPGLSNQTSERPTSSLLGQANMKPPGTEYMSLIYK